MLVTKFLEIAGLFLSIVGALIAYIYREKAFHGTYIYTKSESLVLDKKAAKQNKINNLGFIIIFAGLLLQLIQFFTEHLY